MAKVLLSKSARAFSLLELLCVVAIISILVGLMLGPITRGYYRARGLEGELQSSRFPTAIQDSLQHYYKDQRVYPALTPEQLGALGVFDGTILAYLKRPGVRYIPFSSIDPKNKVILLVNQGKNAKAILRKDQVADW